MKEQIEEMTFILNNCCDDVPNDVCENTPCNRCRAKRLYNAGYRKQREGEWLLIKVPTGVELYGIREVQAYPKCSICEYMGDVSEWHFKYCPNCGAKMQKKINCK